MRKKLYVFFVLTVLWLFTGMFSAAAQGEYLYYVPHVVSYPEFYPANHAYTCLYLTVTRDDTNYDLDLDGDGVYENTYSGLAAGTYEAFYRTNWPSPNGTLATGASIRSDHPLHVLLWFGENDFGTYDSGFLKTSLLPVHQWGEEFVVAANSNYLYIFAASSATAVVTPPGQASVNYVISPRTNVKLSGITAGTTVTADSPVYVLAVNCGTDQNFPWMYNVLPLSMIGNEYFHDSTYGEVDLSWTWPTDPKLWITSVANGTDVYIDEDNDDVPDFTYYLDAGESFTFPNPVQGTHILSNRDIYVVNVENWAAAFRGHYGGAATEYLPVSLYGTEYGLYRSTHGANLPDTDPHIFIVASNNDTSVEIDFGWDGIDLSNTLDRGGVWTVNWPVDLPYTAHIQSTKGIQVIFRTDFAHHDHPGVNCAYAVYSLSVPRPVQAVIDIHPNTLNRKSQGKWVTAYIELPEGYNVEDIVVDTVAVTGMDGVPVDPPLSAQSSPSCIGDYDSDGVPDLMVKFSRNDLIELLTPGDRVVTVSGSLNDETALEGNDTLTVIH